MEQIIALVMEYMSQHTKTHVWDFEEEHGLEGEALEGAGVII